MPLITCPECGRKRVSDSAISCPECGFAIREHFQNITIESVGEESEKISAELDNTKYSIILKGYTDTDADALSGLKEILGDDLSYEDAMTLFESTPCVIIEVNDKSRAEYNAKRFKNWGVEVDVVSPDGDITEYRCGKSTEALIDKDEADSTMKLLSFFIPFVGIILYCVNATEKPYLAKTCIRSAMTGLGVWILICLIIVVI